MSDEGKKIGLFELSDGEPTPFTVNPEERLLEATESAKILGISVREVLDLPNRKIFDSFEARITVAQRLRYYKPKIVLSHYGLTPHDSPDHYQAQLITEGAVFYSRLSKWEEYFENLAPHRIYNIFYFVTLRENPDPLQTVMNKFTVDITEHFDKKIQAIRSYKTQFKTDPNATNVTDWLDLMGRYYGKQIGKKYGELFLSPKGIEVPGFDLWL